MILLDSDHLTVLKYRESDRYQHLTERLAAANDVVGTTIINLEEQMRGWLAVLAKKREVLRQVSAYRELIALFDFFNHLHLLTLNVDAANRFKELRRSQVRIGSMDLKSGLHHIDNGALLLTANQRDFEKVPGLRFENWLN
jgi:tRNA(fMet)-specific endonuclease VapC